MIEIWKDIEGYENLYQVSNMGRVKSLNYRNTGKEQIMKTNTIKGGYQQIRLKGRMYLVHRLVAFAFPEICGEYFEECEISHLDCNPLNNKAVNIRWETHSQNMKNPLTLSRFSLPILQITKEEKIINIWNSSMDIYREMGYDRTNIHKCCHRKGYYKTAYNYKWVFVDDYLADWWEEEMEKVVFN